MIRRSARSIRHATERVFPRGAILLSVLSLAYFATGIIRNRVFANTYGAGAELDAYNAAFRIPEIALDVLVAAGLTAPFVPIYSRLRTDEGHDRSANDFGRTVLTGAVALMTVASAAIFLAAPWLAGVVGDGFDPATRDLYVQLVRINCLAQIMFAASIALGEVLVAHRRFLFYALAPDLLHDRDHRLHGPLRRARTGSSRRPGERSPGPRPIWRSGRSARPGRRSGSGRPSRMRTAAFREFLRLMVPRMFSVAIEPLTITYFTRLATGLGVGCRLGPQLRPGLPGLPVSLIGVSFSLAVFPVLSAAYAEDDGRLFRGVLARNLVTIAILTTLAAVALYVLSGTLVEVLLGRWQVHRRGRRDHVAGRRRVRALGPVRCARLPALARVVRDPRHPSAGRRLVRWPGGRHRRQPAARARGRDPRDPVRVRRRDGREGCVARGLPGGARSADRPRPYGALRVGTTAMYKPSRSG